MKKWVVISLRGEKYHDVVGAKKASQMNGDILCKEEVETHL